MAEFKISRLRFTWKGVWTIGVTYNRDAVVSYNGKTYVCLFPHTATSNFYNDLAFVTSQGESQPRWELMIDGNSWIGDWEPNTVYSDGNIVRYGGISYQCTVPHTSGATSIDLTKWVVAALVASDWTGAWIPVTRYTTGDIVKYGGIVYRCITEHVSAGVSAGLEFNISLWEIVNSGVEYKGVWSGTTRYKLNDLVKESSGVWICTVGHTSSGAFNPTNWNLWLEGLSFEGTWDSTTIYQLGDVVLYGGYSYVSKISNNTSAVPSTATSAWDLLTTGYRLRAEWTSTTAYRIGDVVSTGGNSFVAKQDNTNNPPTVITAGDVVPGGQQRRRVCVTAVGRTLTVSDTTGLSVGMYVSSIPNSTQNFKAGQTITSIEDSTTLIISSPADSSPNGLSIDFFGVNDSWAVIGQTVRWRNRWTTSTDYIAGDVAVWVNITYKCIKTHTSTINPLADNNLGQNWIVYLVHDKFNVLNATGEMIVNTDGENQPLLIGPEGFLLKSVNEVPTWQNVFQTPNVFYVTPDGTDEVTSGNTWDNPYGSINYACQQVAKGIFNPLTAFALTSSVDFIVAEAYAWQVSQVDPLLDAEKTKRDSRLIVEGIIYDLSRGGNSETVANTLAYFDLQQGTKFITTEVENSIADFILTINKIFVLINSVLNNTPVSPTYQTAISQPITSSFELTALTKIAELQNILVTALSEGSTFSVPPANTGMTATIMVKTGTYKETLPIIVPENTALNGDELRGVVVSPKIVINTVASRTRSNNNSITVGTTVGMAQGTPVQFVSINSVNGTDTVFGGLTAGTTYYVIGSSITATSFSVSILQGGSTPVILTNFISTMRVYGGDALSDMFRVRNGSGIRNMTLTGLLGTLTEQNEFLTRRPTGGSFVSLDSGLDPSDVRSWIKRKSPYIQNVTNFGIGCTGLKIDGTLHDGGNKSIVCNDFTQILSDGIGIWCTGNDALCEAVSVFSYYNYVGYLAEDGGRIRATNGNSSYGTFGCIAEGFDDNESPITATINNQYGPATASAFSSLGADASILALQYSHAGENYTQATTNLLTYSNQFTNWVDDGNVTLIQSILSPDGTSNGWIATGNTSGTNSSYFYQDVEIAPSGAFYTGIAGTNDTGSGVGALFDVEVSSNSYIVTVNDGGTGYVATNQIRIFGSQLGGQAGVNDLIITVTGLVFGTTIQTISTTGVVQIGSTQPYTFSTFVKPGTATDFEINAIFSGVSTRTSSISYNTVSGLITPAATSGGLVPTAYQAIPVSSAPGWVRLTFTFYDTNARNNNLQIRIYPRGKVGNTGYTIIFGAQLEVGDDLGFYLKTTTNRFTSFANFNIVGAGSGVDVVGDEIRSKSVYQTRVLTSLGETGGSGYVVATNNAQTGNSTSITVAATDLGTDKTYLGMRVFVNSGLGAGQYGVVSSFDSSSKIASVLKESFKQVTILSATGGTNAFELSPIDDVFSLYIDQPIQFVPTNYNTLITNVSQDSTPVVGTIGGITNTIQVPSTARLAVNMAISFSGTTYGGVTNGFTYYIVGILNNLDIQISTTLGGAVSLLNTASGDMVLNYPSNTNYLKAESTANMAATLPIFFTGIVLDTVQSGTTYFINDVIDGNSFTISPTKITTTATATTAITNQISLDTSAGMVPITPIIFTGSDFAEITEGTKYYINTVVDGTRITISNTLLTTTATRTVASGNQIEVGSTTNFVIGNPITFTGSTFGGIIGDRVYYVLYINNATSLSVSSTSSLVQVTATATTATTNRITVSSTVNLTALNPIKFSGTAGGGVDTGITYYVSRIPNSSAVVVSDEIIVTTANSTASVSNLITVISTTGFVVNNPIVFGGPAIGGITAGQVYYISAINDSTTFTVSAAPLGAAITLSTAVNGDMTVRTTGADLVLSTAVVSLTGTTTFGGAAVTLTDAVGLVSVRSTGQQLSLSTTSSATVIATTTSARVVLGADAGAMISTFTVPILGGVTQGTTYYVTSVTPGVSNVFTVSDIGPGGAVFSVTSGTGSMGMGEIGWDHINPGTPAEVAFDSSTVYSIEPRVQYSQPDFTFTLENASLQPPGTQYVAVVNGNGKFVAIPNQNATISYSNNGEIWNPKTLPTSAPWTSIAFGNKYWVIISSGPSDGSGSKVLYSNSDLETWKTSYLPANGNWSKVVYGNGIFVAITSDSASTASSINFGATWTSMTGLSGTDWSDIAYGGGKFVIITASGRAAAYSTNGTTWTTSATALPIASTWSSVTYGSGKFVAVSAVSATPVYSLDGITWDVSLYPISAEFIAYGQGAFMAITPANALGYSSEDGVRWKRRPIVAASVGSFTFGFTSDFSSGKFLSIGGRDEVINILAGATPKARVVITGSKISSITEWETGSNYSAPPIMTIVDSNAIIPVLPAPRLGNGSLSNPTFINNGNGYFSVSTSITVTGGGYADEYQTGLALIVSNLTKLPRAGDNLAIVGNDVIYKITDATALNGTVAPAILGQIQVSPEITVANSPDHNTAVGIRTKYSQVRLTNHDFLNIGYGNFEESNYPRLPTETGLAKNNEIIENNYGRAFFSSTDQDGNFKVGNLFAVEQATGIVTLSASQFGLSGLNQLRLGGVAVGNASVIITQFSTDSTFVANSDAIIPTQRAIRSHLAARLSQGGSNTFTGQLTAGTVVVGGPDKIGSTVPAGQDGSVVKIPVVANIHRIGDGADGGYGGWDGNGMAMAYFVKNSAHR
jgi:hypothetical protein